MKVQDTINSLIKQRGYIRIDEFMSIALSQCEDSYYISQNPIGEGRDFITAPEISQIFGEIIAIWIVDKWIKLGSPNKFNLIEFGPGKATLVSDIIRSTKNHKDFQKALNIHLIEINKELIKVQKEKLQNYNIPITWHDSLDQIDDYPSIVIGNEFFDSLPIRQYIKIEKLWKERVLILNDVGELVYSEIDIENENIVQYLDQYKFAGNGAIVEISDYIKSHLELIKQQLGKNKLYSLFIDYGYYVNPALRTTNQYNETLQAISKHKYCDIFYNIGKSDLTSHVDFYIIESILKELGFVSMPVISQKEFLINYGVNQRLEILTKNVDMNLKNILYNQYNRLISDKEMGELFKVIEFNNIK